METLEKKAAEMLQKSEVVVLASINQEGYPRPVWLKPKVFQPFGCQPETTHGKQLIFVRIRKGGYVSMLRETAFA